ncbi:MAG TPA: VWA domain-containing protein [Vicinamibacterales bacterium]|nr:VWA domain-containing protein [Vicinamibacterales bacterium]
MTFTAPLGLLALLAIPAIVVIHLFRRRFPARHIAGLFLWQMSRQTPEGGGRISRLPITTSLLLECLAALALALILSGLRLSSGAVATHLVVVLDDSASMSAADARGVSARDRAVRRVLHEIDSLERGARVSLITSGERPAVIAGPAAYAVETRAALEAWKPSAPDHSLAMGIRLGRELAAPAGRLMIVTDLPPAARGDAEVEGALWASVGVPLPNVGIVAAERSVAPEGGHAAIALTLANDSDARAERRLEVVTGSTGLITRDLDLPPGLSSLVLPVSPGLGAVRVTLSADALLRDNEVTLVEPRPRIVGIANHLPEGRGRQALAKALASLSAVTQAEPGHLTFVEAASLDRPGSSGVWRVGIGRPPAGWSGPAESKDYIGPFVLEKRHPLLLGVTLDGVVWTGASPVTSPLVRPIASAGGTMLLGAPASGRLSPDPVVLANLDLARTNLIRSPDWPILVSNLVEWRRQNLPGPERWNYRIGEWVRVQLGRLPKAPLRFVCGGVERTLLSASEIEFRAPSPGGLLQIFEGSDLLFELGLNFFDEAETDLRRQATAEIGTPGDAPQQRGESDAASDPLFWVLLASATAAILGNWMLLAPRRSRA